jgi:predicted NodU family carbamoyl transferase
MTDLESINGRDFGKTIFALTKEELDRLKQWAQVTPQEQAAKLEEFIKQPEVQEEIGAGVARAMEPILKPMFQQIEKAAIEGFDEETAARIIETVWAMIEKKLAGFEQRLSKMEAALFRRGMG